MSKQTFAPTNLFGITIQPTSSSGIAAILQGVAGQTADLLDLRDSAGNNRVTFDAVGNISTVALPAPAAPSLALASNAAGVEVGAHTYLVAFVNANGDTGSTGTTAAITVTTGNRQVNLSAIPLGPTGTTARKIYRSTVGTSTPLKLLTTLADNTTTTYSDTTVDASLGATAGAINATFGFLTLGSTTLKQNSTGGMVLNAPTGATGNLLDVQLNGVSQGRIDNSGGLTLAGFIKATSYFTPTNSIILGGNFNLITSVGTAKIGLEIRGLASQASDLQAWENSTPTTLAGVRADGLIYATGAGTTATNAGIATLQKAGTPADADWTAAPPNGTIVVDSTGNKLWARVGGAWKGVAIA